MAWAAGRLRESALHFHLLCRIHQFLFEEVYDWAGKPRTVGLAKKDFAGEGGRPVAFTAFYGTARGLPYVGSHLAPAASIRGCFGLAP